MCGIAGIVSHEGAKGLVTRDTLHRMAHTLAHRGPDGEGYFVSDSGSASCGFAHRRLAITDPTIASQQPLYYLGRYVIVHNGEIYNHKILRQQLEKCGHTFNSNGDTEVIVAAYHEYGQECLDHFDGMFSFAIWDLLEEKLFCARDRFGEKPFYFHFNNESGVFHFGSEMKALWAAGLPRKMRPQAMLHFLTLGIVGHPHLPELTFFEEIFQLPPAHFLEFDTRLNQLNLLRYWDLDKETLIDIGEAEAISHFKKLLDASVEDRLRSDLPVGATLSGGLDSTTIVSICADLPIDKTLHASFSAVFPGFTRDESEYIREVNDAFGLDAEQVAPDVDRLLENMGKIINHQEEPFTTAGISAQFEVHALAARNGISVLLDGQGADEILGGYSRHTHWFVQELVKKGKFSVAREEAHALKQNGFMEKWGIGNYLAAMFPGIAAGILERKASRIHRWNPDINSDFRYDNSGAGFIYKPVIEKSNDILYFDTCMGGLQTLLRYADRNAMAHGIEVRMPFLQHELVQFIFSLPANMKTRKGLTKWILREAYGSSIPQKILARKGKIGFEPPQEEWMKDHKLSLEMLRARQKMVDSGILAPSVLKRRIDPQPAYSSAGNDWRYWIASQFL